ncbi:hypothetical protein IRT38_01050 (plasmid) [Acinetobacter sp. SK-43]|uniref:hypothetical protein n=1 Tax=Acinetobacter sp. SK-43 TaxID=2785295 RepID=UPI00188D8657|nr:hypothetical protein [Acinetobacter sp. SK-43]MBF4454004.1 hypothetical protein [Acinetobacter sp. SK-43]
MKIASALTAQNIKPLTFEPIDIENTFASAQVVTSAGIVIYGGYAKNARMRSIGGIDEIIEQINETIVVSSKHKTKKAG